MMSFKRNSALDIAKGIAIICMVIGHSGCPQVIRKFVYSFQVPLFFLASGYCFKEGYIIDIRKFALRKMKTLYLPYIKWGVIFVLAHNLLCSAHCYDPEYGFKGIGILPYSRKEILEHLKNSIFLLQNAEPLLGGLWFVRELLIGSFLSLGLLRLIKKPYWVCATLFSVAALLLITKYKTPFLHIGFLSFYAALYIMVGYIGKSKYRPLLLKYDILILIMLIGLFYFFPHPGVLETTRLTFVFYFPLSVVSSYIVFDISQKMQNVERRLVALIKIIGQGENTLMVLTLHFLSFKLVSWLIVIIYGMNEAHIAEFPTIHSYAEKGWWIVYSIVGVTIPLSYCLMRKVVKTACLKDK